MNLFRCKKCNKLTEHYSPSAPYGTLGGVLVNIYVFICKICGNESRWA